MRNAPKAPGAEFISGTNRVLEIFLGEDARNFDR
jgi:hypothetical protein